VAVAPPLLPVQQPPLALQQLRALADLLLLLAAGGRVDLVEQRAAADQRLQPSEQQLPVAVDALLADALDVDAAAQRRGADLCALLSAIGDRRISRGTATAQGQQEAADLSALRPSRGHRRGHAAEQQAQEDQRRGVGRAAVQRKVRRADCKSI